MSTSVVKYSWVKCREGLNNGVSNIIIRYIDHMELAAYMAFSFLSSYIWLYVLYAFVQFCKLCILLLCLSILIVMYVLFCIFCFHRATWHSSATLTEVFPCFFLSCKANARV